jgi:hypothetical protein
MTSVSKLMALKPEVSTWLNEVIHSKDFFTKTGCKFFIFLVRVTCPSHCRSINFLGSWFDSAVSCLDYRAHNNGLICEWKGCESKVLTRGAQILGVMLLWQPNFVWWCQIFVSPQCGCCFMSLLVPSSFRLRQHFLKIRESLILIQLKVLSQNFYGKTEETCGKL